jgi:hypothetical protein
MDPALQEEQLVTSLLAPFERIEPVTLGARRRIRRRRLLVYAVLAVAIVVSGVALAGSFNPLRGIGAADHPQAPSDALDESVEAQLRADLAPPGGVDQIGGRLTGSSRFVGTLPSGRKVYVVPTTKGRLCVLVAGLAESCGSPLTQEEPVTFTTVWRHPGEPAYAYGIARDGVERVSFNAGSRRVAVPVEHNLFAYESEPRNSPAGFDGITVTLADGTVQSVG